MFECRRAIYSERFESFGWVDSDGTKGMTFKFCRLKKKRN